MTTFIIKPDGVVQASEINADGIGRDASTLAHKIKAAQYVRKNPGEVCPQALNLATFWFRFSR